MLFIRNSQLTNFTDLLTNAAKDEWQRSLRETMRLIRNSHETQYRLTDKPRPHKRFFARAGDAIFNQIL